MNGVILWLPGETVLTPSLAPKAEKSILKKRPFQATLSQDLKASLPPEPGVRADDAGSLLKVNNRLTDLDMKVVEISSPQAWEEALQDITQAGICGLDLETTGLDPLSSRARLAQLSLPSGRVYVADLWELGRERASPLQDLGRLLEMSNVKVVGHNLNIRSDLQVKFKYLQCLINIW